MSMQYIGGVTLIFMMANGGKTEGITSVIGPVSTLEYSISANYTHTVIASTTDGHPTMKDYAYLNCSLAASLNCSGNQTTLIDQEALIITHEALKMLMYIFLAIIIACANGLTITAIAKFKSLMTPTNIFILSLSCADFLLSPTLLSIRFIMYITNEDFAKFMYVLVMSLQILSLNMSLLSLVVIAIDRYIAILRPLRYRQLMTLDRAKLIVVLIWCYGSVLVITVVGYFTITSDIQELCQETSIVAILPPMVFLGLIVIQIMLYLVISVVLYIRIFMAIHQRTRKIGFLQGGKDKGSVSAENKRTTKMMATVLGTLTICWLPFTIYSYIITEEMLQDHLWARVFYTIFLILLFSNSFLNSGIYAWRSQKFRKAYLDLLGMTFMHDDSRSNSSLSSIDILT